MELTMKLARVAQKNGGDRYEAAVQGEDKPFVIYFPQSISREGGQVKEKLTVKVS